MKDILFEKHKQSIWDECSYTNSDEEIANIEGAAVACANTTKEMMRNFVDFADNNFTRNLSNGKWIIVSEEYKLIRDEYEELTTEELLEKYLETLNQK